jgi:hypothetical protein
MKVVVQFSGGITSWAAARRLLDEMPWLQEYMVLLFADTLIEDEDNYRFIEEASANLGVPVTRIADGRNPWEVFRDERYLGNTRADPCSKILKRQLLQKWMVENCDQASTKIVLGLNFEEPERITRYSQRMAGWRVWTPLTWKPWLSKYDTLRMATLAGLRPPRMYDMGFAHANCGGFCVKAAGQDNFQKLLLNFPERYKAHEAEEEAMRALLGKNVTILRDRRGKSTKPLSMRAFRERIESTGQYDIYDTQSGCGCAID